MNIQSPFCVALWIILSCTDHRPCPSEIVWIHLSLTKQRKLITRGVVDDVSLKRMLRSIEGLSFSKILIDKVTKRKYNIYITLHTF